MTHTQIKEEILKEFEENVLDEIYPLSKFSKSLDLMFNAGLDVALWISSANFVARQTGFVPHFIQKL